jgi:phospholipid-translocating ATPase
LEKGNRIPSDVIILATTHECGVVYLKTDQLDGETDWKVRESVKSIQALVNSGTDIADVKFNIEVPPPNNKIYEFRGKLEIPGRQSYEPLRLQNTAWSSTSLASGDFYGVVSYVGRDTRIQMNANASRIKFPICDFEINDLSKYLFLFCVIASFSLVLMNGFRGDWVTKWVMFLVLLCTIIPQSLRTNLDIIKLIYAYRVNIDQNIEGTVCRNSQITEELGRVNYLLSDKTGTLTKNDMIFKKITTEAVQYTEEDFVELKSMIKTGNPLSGDKLNKKTMDTTMLMYSLVLCNNVQPCVDNHGKRFLQSSSPDEIALVEFAEKMGFFMENRDREMLYVKEPTTGEELNQYKILDSFPFSSSRKRMGIILRIMKTNKIIYLLKGADTVIKERVDKNGEMVVEEADNLAKEGLRTLAFCFKYVEDEQYNDWKKKYLEVTSNLSSTEEDEDEVITELEKGMKFIGISGVEDLLQDQIRETIESVRESGIRVWVLTGDKVETAKCIAKSTGLKGKTEQFFEMLDEDIQKIESQILQITNKKVVLVIQGNVLSKIFEKGLEKPFFQAIAGLPSIAFCRCSPTQKAIIVKAVQDIIKGVVCSIGTSGVT